MKNKRAKGNRVRRFVIDFLEKQGYIVAIVERTGRFIFPKDMFGLFDLISLKNDDIKFIQVTCNKPHSHKRLQNFSEQYSSIAIEQWVWVDRKGFDVYSYEQGQVVRLTK